MTRADTYAPSATGVGTAAQGGLTGAGTVTITNNLASTDLYDVSMSFLQGSTLAASWAASPVGSAQVTPSGSNILVHIPKLGHGASITLTYTVDPNAAKLPVDLTESYSNYKIPQKINDPSSQTVVTMTLTKDETTSGSCTISPLTVSVSNTLSPAPWTFTAGTTLSGTDTVASNTVTWTSGGLAHGASPITATYTAALTNAGALTSANALTQYSMAQATVAYQINGGSQTASGVTVSGSPTATTQNVGVDMIKTYVPGTGYQFTPQVMNNQPTSGDTVDFTLNSVNYWYIQAGAVAGTPQDQKTIVTGNPALPGTISPGGKWVGPTITENPAYVPAGFLNPILTIADDGSGANAQIQRTYTSTNGLVTMVQSIWILNGYQIEVTKTVAEESGSPGTFDVTIAVKNTGTLISPDVFVYDIVPQAWYNSPTASTGSPTSFNHVPVNGYTGTSVSTPINGYGYYWDEGTIAANSAGITQTYKLTGPANYALSQVWVVGVDPAQSTNVLTTPSLQNAASMVNANFESLAALGAFALVVVGMFGTYRRRF